MADQPMPSGSMPTPTAVLTFEQNAASGTVASVGNDPHIPRLPPKS